MTDARLAYLRRMAEFHGMAVVLDLLDYIEMLRKAKGMIIDTQSQWVCPVCGYEENAGADGVVGVTVSVPPYTGHYCMRCYAAWMANNLPKLQRKKGADDE